jgi:hypothetical protein
LADGQQFDLVATLHFGGQSLAPTAAPNCGKTKKGHSLIYLFLYILRSKFYRANDPNHQANERKRRRRRERLTQSQKKAEADEQKAAKSRVEITCEAFEFG